MKKVFLAILILSLLALSLFAQTVPPPAPQNCLETRLEYGPGQKLTYGLFNWSHFSADGKYLLPSITYMELPQYAYKEFSIGVGRALVQHGDLSVYFIANLVSASDDYYVLPATLALDATGDFNWSIYVASYRSLGQAGITQFLVDPADFAYRVAGPVYLGASVYYWKPEGGEAVYKAGPKICAYGFEVRFALYTSDGHREALLRKIFLF